MLAHNQLAYFTGLEVSKEDWYTSEKASCESCSIDKLNSRDIQLFSIRFREMWSVLCSTVLCNIAVFMGL